jgi:inorganic pyrophosphatase
MIQQLDKIRNKLEQLRQLDPFFEIFGASKHQYKINPKVSAKKLKQFEADHQINLPAEYAAFITQIGDGGAGPFYGLEPLKNVLYYDLDAREKDNLLNPSKPFLHTEAWNMTFNPTVDIEEDEQEYDKEYDNFSELYFNKEHLNGVIAICNYGCGVSINLVVNGQEYGNIWSDDRGSSGGIYPTTEHGITDKITFLYWYELWLDQSIAEMKSKYAIISKS